MPVFPWDGPTNPPRAGANGSSGAPQASPAQPANHASVVRGEAAPTALLLGIDAVSPALAQVLVQGCASCVGMLGPKRLEPAEEARYDEVRRRMSAGERLSADDRKFLEHVASLANKGIISLAAGVALQVKTGRGMFEKTALEAHSDKGFIVKEEVGKESRVGRMKTKSGLTMDTSSSGSARPLMQVEADVIGRRVGPAEARLTGGYELKGESKGPYVKGALQAEGGPYKAELYAKARLNELDPLESDALEARMRLNASAVRDRREDRIASMDQHRAQYEAEAAAASAAREQALHDEMQKNADALRAQREQRMAGLERAHQQAFGPKPPPPPFVVAGEDPSGDGT
jgi:hypothetical protein